MKRHTSWNPYKYLLIVGLTAVLLASCGSPANDGQSPDTIQTVHIGVMLPQSGLFESLGRRARLVLDEAFVRQLPIEDVQVTFTYCDNETTLEGAIACAESFIADSVDVVIGGILVSFSNAAGSLLNDARIPFISIGSMQPSTPNVGDYVYKIPYDVSWQALALAQHAQTLNDTARYVILNSENDSYASSLADASEAAFESLAGTTTRIRFDANETDIDEITTSVIAASADVIVYAGFCSEGLPLITNLRNRGYQGALLTIDIAAAPECQRSDALVGSVRTDGYVLESFSGTTRERGEAFATQLRTAHPESNPTIETYTLSARDALGMVLHVVSDMDIVDSEAIQRALANLNAYPGVTGDITYAGTGGTPTERTVGLFLITSESGVNVEQAIEGILVSAP